MQHAINKSSDQLAHSLCLISAVFFSLPIQVRCSLMGFGNIATSHLINFRETRKQRPNFVGNWREATILGIITFFFFFWGGGANKPTYFSRTRERVPPPHPLQGPQFLCWLVNFIWSRTPKTGFIGFIKAAIPIPAPRLQVHCQSNEDSKDQKSIQSSTTSVPGYQTQNRKQSINALYF